MGYENMEHLAIMRKSWGLTHKILKGQKNIESRWYSIKYKPWDNIKKGETVYFKDSGEPVSLKAQVGKVMQFENLDSVKVKKILIKYGCSIGIGKSEIPVFLKVYRNKKYAILIFLKNPQRVQRFQINKKGFGAMASWIIVKSISKIKKNS